MDSPIIMIALSFLASIKCQDKGIFRKVGADVLFLQAAPEGFFLGRSLPVAGLAEVIFPEGEAF